MSTTAIDEKKDSSTHESIQYIGLFGKSINNVEWENKNIGHVTTQFSRTICYSITYAIELAIRGYIERLINNPIKFQDGKLDYVTYPFDPLGLTVTERNTIGRLVTRPLFYKKVKKNISEIVPSVLKLSLKKYNIDSDSISDFIFLALLSLKRNWKSGCAICLTDEIMGTTCTCGHTEIAVFRPCGHSLCAKPCFENFLKSKGVSLDIERTVVDNIEYTIPTQKNINIETNFDCPLCRKKVKSVFRAEDVHNADNLFDMEKLVKDIFDKSL